MLDIYPPVGNLVHVNPTPASAAVAEEVRALMARRRIPQSAIASALGRSQSSISRRLAGAQPFTVDELYQLADVFDISPSELIPVEKSA